MKKKGLAKSAEELDRRFDAGEDIHELIDMSKTAIVRHSKKVRITIDMSEALVSEIDEIRQEIGVDRGALIKVWLHERVKQEKTVTVIFPERWIDSAVRVPGGKGSVRKI